MANVQIVAVLEELQVAHLSDLDSFATAAQGDKADAALPASEVGQSVASLVGGKVPAAQLPAASTCIPIACSDETTALTTGAGKVTFRMPFAMTSVSVRASLTTPQTSGALITIDVKEGGVSLFSTKPTFDNTEKSTVTAGTPAVLADTTLADDAEITIDITQVGDGTAKGLKVYILGNK